MKQLKHFALCALLIPAVGFSAGTVAQDDDRQGVQGDNGMTDDRGTEGRTGTDERRGGMTGDGGGPGGDAEGATGDHGRTDRTTGDGQRWDDTDGDDRQAGDRQGTDGMAGADGDAEYLSVAPHNAVRVDEVIGGSLHMRDDDEEVGNINDLLIDETGQVVAVIVDVGGFLGIGQRSVAVSWDSVEQTRDEDDDGYRFTLNATEQTLRDAPSFDDDERGIRNER